MKSMRFIRSAAVLAALTLASLPSAAEACAVCMGDPASKTAGALNNAIFLMLGFIGLMLACVGAFIFNLMQRAKAPVPPHQELAKSINQESTTA
jgi:hypothetical protein